MITKFFNSCSIKRNPRHRLRPQWSIDGILLWWRKTTTLYIDPASWLHKLTSCLGIQFFLRQNSATSSQRLRRCRGVTCVNSQNVTTLRLCQQWIKDDNQWWSLQIRSFSRTEKSLVKYLLVLKANFHTNLKNFHLWFFLCTLKSLIP